MPPSLYFPLTMSSGSRWVSTLLARDQWINIYLAALRHGAELEDQNRTHVGDED
jgi:hypothetical protein